MLVRRSTVPARSRTYTNNRASTVTPDSPSCLYITSSGVVVAAPRTDEQRSADRHPRGCRDGGGASPRWSHGGHGSYPATTPCPRSHRADPLENFSRHRRRYDRRDCGTRRHDRRTEPHRPCGGGGSVIHLRPGHRRSPGLPPSQAQAQREGVPLWITSGKRSWAEQESMWRDGIATYGSPAAALDGFCRQPSRLTSPVARSTSALRGRTVARPQGDPLGPVPHVRQRWWHFEGRDRAADPCPPKYVDSAHR